MNENIESIVELMDEFQSTMEEVLSTLPHVSAHDLGLDRRAGMVWVDSENQTIVSIGNSLSYYGGFEYVSDSNKTEMGSYTIYSAEGNDGSECSRVVNAIDRFDEINNDEE